MKRQQIPIETMNTLIQRSLVQTVNARLPVMEQFKKLQENHVTRLANTAQLLKTHLGADHPRVLSLERAASLADKLKQSMSTAVERQARLPRLKQDDWLVFGRVLDTDGNPVQDLHVRMYDKDKASPEYKLNDAVTDENGEFFLTYNKSAFSPWGESLPDLYVRVEDNKGNMQHLSRKHVGYNAGRAEYFEIVMGEETPGKKNSQKQPSKVSTKPDFATLNNTDDPFNFK